MIFSAQWERYDLEVVFLIDFPLLQMEKMPWTHTLWSTLDLASLLFQQHHPLPWPLLPVTLVSVSAIRQRALVMPAWVSHLGSLHTFCECERLVIKYQH